MSDTFNSAVDELFRFIVQEQKRINAIIYAAQVRARHPEMQVRRLTEWDKYE